MVIPHATFDSTAGRVLIHRGRVPSEVALERDTDVVEIDMPREQTRVDRGANKLVLDGVDVFEASPNHLLAKVPPPRLGGDETYRFEKLTVRHPPIRDLQEFHQRLARRNTPVYGDADLPERINGYYIWSFVEADERLRTWTFRIIIGGKRYCLIEDMQSNTAAHANGRSAPARIATPSFEMWLPGDSTIWFEAKGEARGFRVRPHEDRALCLDPIRPGRLQPHPEGYNKP